MAQFNPVFALLNSMPHFKSINFYQNEPKIKLFLQKFKIFERLGLSPQTPKIAPLQISGYAPESSYVFALPISMPPELSLMPRFKNINFQQNKPKIEIFLQNIKFFE